MNPIKEETKDSADDLEKKVSVKMAADVLQSLSKAIKALKLYPDNSPVKHKFISDLTGKFTKFLEEYLPQQLSDEELTKLVEQAITDTGAASISEMGKVIGLVMGQVKGRSDGARISALVQQRVKQKLING